MPTVIKTLKDKKQNKKINFGQIITNRNYTGEETNMQRYQYPALRLTSQCSRGFF